MTLTLHKINCHKNKCRNGPKYPDRQVLANMKTQIRLTPSTGSTLFAIPSLSFGCIVSRVSPYCSNFRIIIYFRGPKNHAFPKTLTKWGGIFRSIICEFFSLTIFALKRSGGGGVWLLASPKLITFVLGTRNKGQGGLFTSFSIIDYLYTRNQQLMQTWWMHMIK